MKLTKQVLLDISNFYNLAYDNYKKKNPNSYKVKTEWNNWKIEVTNYIKQLKSSEIIKHWNKFKSVYLSDKNIPNKWKNHIIYFFKLKSKQWYLICDKIKDNIEILGACNAQSLCKDANNIYVKIKESLLSLSDYIFNHLTSNSLIRYITENLK